MSDNVTQMFPRPERKRSVHLAILIAVFVLVIGTVIALLCYESGHFDSLRRFFTYLGSDGEDYFTYEMHSGSIYADLNRDLAVASSGELTMLTSGGSQVARAQVSLTTPALQLGRKVAMAYDVGGTTLAAISEKQGTVLNESVEGTILDADISNGDRICVASYTSSYKTVLTAYNADYQAYYRWYSSSAFLPNCAISKDGSWMAAVGLGQQAHTFDSTLYFFNTESEEDPTSVSLGDLLVLDMDITKRNQIVLVGDSRAQVCNRSGEEIARYEYGSSYLENFDFGGNDFLTLAMNMYMAGNNYSLVTVPLSGGEAHTVYLGEEILSLSAKGDYIAVLTMGGLTIYRSDLTEYAKTEEIASVSDVVMRDDGSALLIGSNSARLFIP